jgi:hypothetical protein
MVRPNLIFGPVLCFIGIILGLLYIQESMYLLNKVGLLIFCNLPSCEQALLIILLSAILKLTEFKQFILISILKWILIYLSILIALQG